MMAQLDELLRRVKGIEPETYEYCIDKYYRRPMSPEEKAELGRQGLCSYCRESGHERRNCPNRKYAPLQAMR